MRKLLPLLFYGVLICMGLVGHKAFSQINYTADFNAGSAGWQSETFLFTDEVPCEGAGALSANLWFFEPAAEVVSPGLGTSNGGVVTLSYSYKVLNYDSSPTDPALNSDNWGTIQVYYGTTATGPWNLIQTINPQNHTESAACQVKTVTFSPASGSMAYVRFFTESTNEDGDYLIYLDQVAATQAAPTGCNGTPPASSATAASSIVCSTQNAVLSLSPAYTDAGLTYQWQISADGVTYVNAGAGSTVQNYSALQSAATWYRAIVTCTASGSSVISTPVQVQSTGLPCYCNTIGFTSDVEPITLVNFAGINNVSSNSVTAVPSLQNFTGIAPAQVGTGQTYPISIKGNTNGDFESYFTVFIDFNHNGSFTDAGEAFEAGMVENSDGTDALSATTQITIPVAALTGLTQMRVVKNYGEYAANPCGSYDYGQAEDYLVNITEAPACETAPVTAVILAQNNVICANQGTTLSLNTTYTSGETFQWQQSGNGITYENIPGATGITYQVSQLNTTYYRLIIYCEEGNLSVTTQPVQITTQSVFPPVLGLTPAFCNSATLSDLSQSAVGTQITWYTTPFGGMPLNNNMPVVNGQTYYASDTVNGCESPYRLEITPIITTVTVPVAASPQIITVPNATIADIEINSGQNSTIVWYNSVADANNEVNPLPLDTPLSAVPTIYYAVQMVNGCSSAVVAVTANTVPLSTNNFKGEGFTYYPNPVYDVLNIAYSYPIDAIEVYTVMGQRVMAKTINNKNAELNLANLTPGMYIVKVLSGTTGKNIQVIKL